MLEDGLDAVDTEAMDAAGGRQEPLAEFLTRAFRGLKIPERDPEDTGREIDLGASETE
jgi:hypothetical protein